MLGRTYDTQQCSAARALELVGERWSLLIMRDALFRGITRFSAFQRSLGVAPNILADRLDGFVRAGLMERHAVVNQPSVHDYLPTDKGRDLVPVIVALTAWGDRWLAPGGPPIVFGHAGCSGTIEQGISCGTCGCTVDPHTIETRDGPGSRGAGTSGVATVRP